MHKSKHTSRDFIDDKDARILSVVQDDGKLSLREIAKKTLLSPATVMNRLSRLESGVIKRYTVQLDCEAAGYELSAVIRLRVMKGKLFDVEKQIARSGNVHAVYDVTGDFDAVVLAKFRGRRELDTFVKRIQAMEYVERTETNLILNVIKEEPFRI
jgi:DNA-binding Lrp family transcriptional regulator